MLHLVVSDVAVRLADLVRDRPLSFAHHDEVLLPLLLLVGQAALVALMLPPIAGFLAPFEDVTNAFYLAGLSRPHACFQRIG